MISHLHVGKLKGSHTSTTVNQPVLAHGTSISPDTTPLKNMEHLKDVQIESVLQITIMKTRSNALKKMKTRSNALKKMMTQNLSLVGLIAHLLIPGAMVISATWKTIFVRNATTVARND